MPRSLRITYSGAWYHVINRGRNKAKIFFDDGDYRFFLHLLERVVFQFGVEVHAYSLMPNHYHLLLHTPKGNLPAAMQYLNFLYTQFVNRKHNFDGSLFRGRYKAILVDADVYLLELVRYIHRNPLKARLETTLGQHPWTSHKAYMQKQPPAFLSTKKVFQHFSSYETEARKQLNAFVAKDSAIDLESKIEGLKISPLLGGDALKEKIKMLALGKKIHVVKKEEGSVDIRPDLLIKEIALNKKIDALNLKKNYRYRNWRRGIIFVCRRYLQHSGVLVSAGFGGMNLSVLSRHYALATHDYENKTGCYAEINFILKLLKIEKAI